MAGIPTRTRTRIRRLVQPVVVALLAAAALAAAITGLVDVARGAPAAPRTPHSSTAPASHDGGGSGHRLWSVFKHLWTSVGMAMDSPHVGHADPPPDVRAAARNADGRRTPTVVSVYAAQGRDDAAGGGPRAHTGYFGSRLKEAADQR
ncbi:hypothetical protein [Streptomyces xanthophaeus]|uniref:hypothetical protein n=1 Tax=Streptomyces xanthophaeus TaxID=67385 RepID=UPI002648F023|nr:hypothetical protein [Streptomyces xanthophaeus]WKD34174.1 hypothetical protein KO717_20905 [Streptomyces xanthophaeus]